MTKTVSSPLPDGPSRTARMLALAHHIDRLVEDGTIPDYAAAARTLGLTRARLTQVMNLLLLAPEIQERVLTGELWTERSLRDVVAEAEWEGQGSRASHGPRSNRGWPITRSSQPTGKQE
jgi:hypothetical protein